MFNRMELDSQSGLPVYVQIADYIRDQIKSGALPAGSKLPSLAEMKKIFSVSRNTCLNALDVIKSEGLIEISPKKRPVVVDNSISLPSKTSPDWPSYIKSGKHFPTQDLYHNLSYNRGKSGFINSYEMRLGKDFNPDLPIKEALSKMSRKVSDIYHHSFFDIKGIPMVREQVCASVRRYGIEADPSQVLMASGPMNAMFLVCRGLLSPGMDIFVQSPNTLSPMNFFNTSGLNIVDLEHDDDGVIINDLKSKTQRTKGGLLHLNAVAFWPDLVTMTKHRIKGVYDLCCARKLPIMENDMMREYWLVDEPPMPLKAFDKSGLDIYIFSFTRPLIPGARIAAIIAPEAVINQIADVKLQGEWGTDTIAQLMMGELLSENLFFDYMNEIRPKLLSRRDEVHELMVKYLGDIASWEKMDCGLSFWIRFNEDIDTRLLGTEKEGVLIYSGAIVGRDFRNCIWLAYSGITLDDMESVLVVISRLARNAMQN